MKGSRRGLLDPLQALVLERLSAELPDFFLTGGTALAEFYLGHRRSEDLDLFTTLEDAFRDADARVRFVAGELGLALAVTRSSGSFRRYVLEGKDGNVVVDLIHDPVPQIDPDKPVIDGIRTDTLREIAVNKLCTLLERWEARDLIDLMFIERSGMAPLDLVQDARRKDGGLTPASLAYAIATAPVLSALPPGLQVDLTLEELETFRRNLVDRLVDMAKPQPG